MTHGTQCTTVFWLSPGSAPVTGNKCALDRLLLAPPRACCAHTTQPSQVPSQALCPLPADFDVPLWKLGTKTYHVLRDGSVLAAFSDPRVAGTRLRLVPPGGGAPKIINTGVWVCGVDGQGLTGTSYLCLLRNHCQVTDVTWP